MSENGKRTYKEKLHDPILNPIQITILMAIMIFTVVTNILPILMGLPINPIWVLFCIIMAVVSFAVATMLRAAYPEQVPDTRITTAFKIFIKQIIDALLQNKEEKSDFKVLLERIIVWSMREWDVIYQMELQDAIDYYKSRLKQEKEPGTIIYKPNSETAINTTTAE